MYDDHDTMITTGSWTCSATSGGIGTITIPTTGTGYSGSQLITVTAGGGGGGGYATSPMFLSTGTGPGYSTVDGNRATITLSANGEIYRGPERKGNGVFERLERLERMLGILHRDANLEALWPPLRDIGDAYDEICDEAIRRISEVVAGELKALHDQYEDGKTQANVYMTLCKEV